MAHYRSTAHITNRINKTKKLIEVQSRATAFVFRYIPTSTRFDGKVLNSHKILQDLLWKSEFLGLIGNNLSIAYTAGATAGAEVVSAVGNAVSIQIEDGVSTANQIIAAFNTYVTPKLVVQDLTYTALLSLGYNGKFVNITYTAGATAGAEVVTVTGNDINVQIQDGVSTATQIETAINGSAAALLLITVAVSGTAGNPQDAAVQAFLAGSGTSADEIRVILDGSNVAQDIESAVNLILVDFESNAGADIVFYTDGSKFTVAKADIYIVNRLRTKRYLFDANAITVV